MELAHREIVDMLVAANYHRPGLAIADCGLLKRTDFAALQEAANEIIATRPYSVISAGHITNWTKPFGTAHQWSLWNTSGDTADTSSDFSYDSRGRTFAHAGLEPFFSNVPGLANLRMNMLMPASGLSPHEEHIVLPGGKVRIRYHIPIKTNREAAQLLEQEWYHMRAGRLYLFNNGCVHAARNGSETQARIHLVFDVMLTEEACEVLGHQYERMKVPDSVITEDEPLDYVPSPGVTEKDFPGPEYWS